MAHRWFDVVELGPSDKPLDPASELPILCHFRIRKDPPLLGFRSKAWGKKTCHLLGYQEQRLLRSSWVVLSAGQRAHLDAAKIPRFDQ